MALRWRQNQRSSRHFLRYYESPFLVSFEQELVLYIRAHQPLGSEDKEVKQRSLCGRGSLAQDYYSVSYPTFKELFRLVTPWGRSDRADALVVSFFNVSS